MDFLQDDTSVPEAFESSAALTGGDRGPLWTLTADVLLPVYWALRGSPGAIEGSTPWLGRLVTPAPLEFEPRLVVCSNLPIKFATLCRGRSSGSGLDGKFSYIMIIQSEGPTLYREVKVGVDRELAT